MVTTKLLSVSDVAKRYGVSSASVIRAIRTGKVKARKVGWLWVIRETDLSLDWPTRSRA